MTERSSVAHARSLTLHSIALQPQHITRFRRSVRAVNSFDITHLFIYVCVVCLLARCGRCDRDADTEVIQTNRELGHHDVHDSDLLCRECARQRHRATITQSDAACITDASPFSNSHRRQRILLSTPFLFPFSHVQSLGRQCAPQIHLLSEGSSSRP